MTNLILIIAVVVAVMTHRKLCKVARAIEQLRTDIAELNAATNELAAVITDLRDKVTTDMTDAEVTEVKDALDAATARLTGLAAGPERAGAAG